MSAERERAQPLIDLVVALVTFYLINDVLKPFEAIGLVGAVLDPLLALALGVIVPVFGYGRPFVELKWRIANREVENGVYQLDLSSTDEVNFLLDVSAGYSSLTGWWLMRRAIKKKTEIVVTMRPSGVLRLKTQICTGDAQVNGATGEIIIPLSAMKGLQHGRSAGAFVAAVVNHGIDRMETTVLARRRNDPSKTRWMRVVEPFDAMTIRRPE